MSTKGNYVLYMGNIVYNQHFTHLSPATIDRIADFEDKFTLARFPRVCNFAVQIRTMKFNKQKYREKKPKTENRHT